MNDQILIDAPHIVPGWACGRCKVYNGAQRDECRGCRRRSTLSPEDRSTMRAAAIVALEKRTDPLSCEHVRQLRALQDCPTPHKQ